MSSLVLFSINDKIKYKETIQLSKQLISYCLNKNLGVIFNFFGYSESLINQLHPNLYFCVSDDFVQLNSEFLSTSEIVHFKSIEGEKAFYEKFHFLDEVLNILIDFGLKEVNLIISCDECENIDNFLKIKKDSKSIVEILYESILSEKDKHAYGFPNVMIVL